MKYVSGNLDMMLMFARNNNVAMLKKFFEKGVPITSADSNGNTPLHYAAGSNSVAAAEFLIESGAYIDAFNSKKQSPINLAARTGSVDVFKLFVANNAIVDTTEPGSTYFYYHSSNLIVSAREGNSTEILDILNSPEKIIEIRETKLREKKEQEKKLALIQAKLSLELLRLTSFLPWIRIHSTIDNLLIEGRK